MSTGEPTWDLYGAFLAVMETGSLSGAARRLEVAQPTVRRQIEQLEETLGVVLFTRASNGLVPTDVANATLPHAQAIASSARAFVRAVSGANEPARGTVRVACSEIMATEVLPPILDDLRRAAPMLQLELAVSNANEDLLRRDADVAVRMVRPTQAGLVARRVGVIPVGLFATKKYLERHPPPRTLADLRDHVLIGGDRDRAFVDALAAQGLELRASDVAIRTDHQPAQLAAVRAGLGIGACQVPVARSLVRVIPSLTFPLDTHVVMHEDLRASARVRRVFDHLVAQLVAYARAEKKVERRSRSRSSL